MKSDNVRAVCADAHKYGMTVTGHIPQGMNAYEGVNDGMDMINHIHYVTDMFMPEFDHKKATRQERLTAMASTDVNSEAGRKAVAFLKEHGTVIDPTIALYELQFRPASKPATEIEPGIARVAPELREAADQWRLPAGDGPVRREDLPA